jgi:hypothetical protein
MTIQRFIGFSALLCVAASCASLNQAAKQKAAPAAGPKAWIYASYTGGLLNRRVDPVFKVDQSAYVMIAHLGGDGQIEVLYPRSARESGRVPGGKYFRSGSFSAYYDAAPQLYSFATTHFRNIGARMDSYDGRGHGFVFMIAGRDPLRFDRISEFGLWDEFEVVKYRFTDDPRKAIRDFAEMIAGNQAYTLKFASNFEATDASSYADYLFDCASFPSVAISSLGLWGFPSGAWGFFASSGRGYFSNCPQYGYRLYAFGDGFYRPTYTPTPTTGRPTGPQNPQGGTLTLTRPTGFRRPGEAGPALGFNRPTFNRPPTGTVDFAPRDGDRVGRQFGPSRGTEFGDRSSPKSTPAFDPPHSTPTYDAPRSTPVHDAPRSYTPPIDRVQPVPQQIAPSSPPPPPPQASPAPAASKPVAPEEKKP